MRRLGPFLLALVVCAVALPLAGFGVESLLRARAAPEADHVEVIVADSTARLGPDAAVSFTVLASSHTVKDSAIACAVYRTADNRVGLMTPAYIARRVDRFTVQPDYVRDVATRCTPLLEANGLRVTSETVHRVLEWRLTNKSRRAAART